MSHLPILPILIPLLMGTLMLLPPLGGGIRRQRATSVISLLVLIAAAFLLMQQSLIQSQIYVLGDWRPPFGIILVADRLSALLVLLTSVLAFGALLYSLAGDDNKGKYFHSLFMYQLMGINGAFLTGDIFNLFVFFEVLLIASYALLIHGGGKQKTQASVHYITLNLIGSAFFLFALGILYGTLGTLNMADMAVRVADLSPSMRILAQSGVLLLLLVFGLKTAMLPLHFWLPRTYSVASAPVAALFAIMTKVGIYAIFRIHTVVFGAGAGELAFVAVPWIWPLAIGTSDRFVVSRPMAQAPILGALFLVAAVTVVGLPPLSGFIGKALLLQAADTTATMAWVWSTILLSSLAVMVALSRAGTNLFWHLSGSKPSGEKAAPVQLAAVIFLLAASPLLVIFGGSATEFAAGAVAQMEAIYPDVQPLLEGGR